MTMINHDAESAAISRMVAILEPLDDEARRRALAYVSGRYISNAISDNSGDRHDRTRLVLSEPNGHVTPARMSGSFGEIVAEDI